MTITDTFLMDRYAPEGQTAGDLTAEDRLDIVELTNRFDWAIDTRRYEALAGLFTEDAVVDHDWGYMDGPRAIVEMIGAHRPDEEGVRHQTTGHVITAESRDDARMVAFLLVLRVGGRPEAPYVIAHAVQQWHLRRTEDGWRIGRLTLDQTSLSALDAPREAVEAVAMTADARAEAAGRPTPA